MRQQTLLKKIHFVLRIKLLGRLEAWALQSLSALRSRLTIKSQTPQQ